MTNNPLFINGHLHFQFQSNDREITGYAMLAIFSSIRLYTEQSNLSKQYGTTFIYE